MNSMNYTALDLAYIIIGWDMTSRESSNFLNFVWEKEYEFLEASLKSNKKSFILNILLWASRLEDEGTLDQEYPAIKKDFQALRLEDCPLDSSNEYYNVDLFFKLMRLKLLYLNKKDYTKIKLRTMINHYGYKRRSEQLMAYIEKCMRYYHLKAFVKGNVPCDVKTVKLDEMVMFRELK